MTTFTSERKEKAIAISNWFVSAAIKNFSYLDNSAIPGNASRALFDLKSFKFDDVEKFLFSLECLLSNMPAAFDDKIMRAKFYYPESEVADIEKAKSEYINNLQKVITNVQATIDCE